jgi:hypothetical protein
LRDVKRQALSVLLLSPALVFPAAAGEICVACSGPPEIYRCVVEDADRLEGYRHSKRVLQIACITELAKAGGHQQCRVQRTGSESCFGFRRTISLKGTLESFITRVEAEPGEAPADEQQPPAAAKKEDAGPPRTVEELARRTADSSKEQLKKTGKAVKQGLNCLTSLFKDC